MHHIIALPYLSHTVHSTNQLLDLVKIHFLHSSSIPYLGDKLDMADAPNSLLLPTLSALQTSAL